VKDKNRENGCQCYLTDQRLFHFLTKCDNEMAEACRQVGCQHCSGVLHRSEYKRKPRGGPASDGPPPDVYRDSFCCDQEGCRKRHTPPSIRLFGAQGVLGGGGDPHLRSAARDQRSAPADPTRALGNQPANPGTVASVVAGHLCACADATPSNSDARSGPDPAPICLPGNSVRSAIAPR